MDPLGPAPPAFPPVRESDIPFEPAISHIRFRTRVIACGFPFALLMRSSSYLIRVAVARSEPDGSRPWTA
jgi:hypothetical protein